MSVIVYTDGSARGNPGNGGYGIVMISGSYRKEFSQGYKLTTNNRMELLSVIVSLEKLKKINTTVVVYSDSKYVVDAVEKRWVFKWEKNYYKNKKNSDLWKRFLKVYKKHLVSFVWVKGHSDNKENNRCDILAVEAADSNNLISDSWYEENVSSKNQLF
tara:strand:+ start:19088 stop:19564 length:477 start_codon:yes stop_codon:yes gene_type:complete